MANGLMGSMSLPDATTQLIATVTPNCIYAEIDILALNATGNDVAVEIAITPNTSTVPAVENYIEKGGIAKASGGSVEHTKRKVSPGAKIFAKAAAGVVINVSGQAFTKRQ